MRKPSLTAALVATGTVFLATAASAARRLRTDVSPAARSARRRRSTSPRRRPTTRPRRSTSSRRPPRRSRQAPGTTIGTVTASINAKAISPDAIIPLTGTVIVADPTKYTSPTDHRSAPARRPTQPSGTSRSPRRARRSTSRSTSTRRPLRSPALGVQTTLVTCLASPDVGAACAATLCAKLLDVNFTVNGIFTKGTSPTWISEFTPYTPGTANPNAAGTVTALGLDIKPVVTLAAKAGKGKAVLAGRVTLAGQAAARVPGGDLLNGAQEDRASPRPTRPAATSSRRS